LLPPSSPITSKEAHVDPLTRIEAAARRWNVLDHPFYQRWSAGELSAGELAEYAAQYRHAVVALADAAAATGNEEHAREEREHVVLWDAFAAGCGSVSADANAETLECASAWKAGDDRLERLAVLYAIESAQPAIARTKLEGLVGHYGFEEGPATEYFSLHAERDFEHAAASRAELELLATDADAERLAARAEAAARGNWRLLDGVSS
jgi:pyrroloquinoline-quinone synthase